MGSARLGHTFPVETAPSARLPGGTSPSAGLGPLFAPETVLGAHSAETERDECGAGIRVSMDGRGRALDNVFVERLWRSVKYEDIYLHEYATVPELEKGLAHYFTFYNHERPHQSLSSPCGYPLWRL